MYCSKKMINKSFKSEDSLPSYHHIMLAKMLLLNTTASLLTAFVKFC